MSKTELEILEERKKCCCVVGLNCPLKEKNEYIQKYIMRSIVGRVGGKSKLKDYIISLIPNHKIYVEAFVGGGAVFFGKDKSDIEVVNDLDKDIYHIYKDMKAVGEQMINKDFTPSRDKFERLKKQNTFNSKAERLFRNLYLSLNSFRKDRKNYVGEKEEKYRKGESV